MYHQTPSPRNRNQQPGSVSPLPAVPGVDRSDSYPRRAPSFGSGNYSGTSTPRGSLPQVSPSGGLASCSASEYASCDEQMPCGPPGAGGAFARTGSNMSALGGGGMPPSPHGSAGRDQNSSGEGSRRSKQIFMQRTTYHTAANGEKRKDTMTWSYVSSESDTSSRPDSNSKPRQSRSQGAKPPMPQGGGTHQGEGPFAFFAQGGAQQQPNRPSTYSEGVKVDHSQYPGVAPTAGMEVIYNDQDNSDSDFSFCDVAEQEPDRPSTADVIAHHQQQQQQQQGQPLVPGFDGSPAPPVAGGCALPPMSSGRGSGRGSLGGSGGGGGLDGTSPDSGRNPAPSFATRYRGTVKSYSKQNESSVGNTTTNGKRAPSGPRESPRRPPGTQDDNGSAKQRSSAGLAGIKAIRKSTTDVVQPRKKPTTTVSRKPRTTATKKLARQHLFDDEEDSSDAFGSSSSDLSDDDGYETPLETMAQ